MSEKIPWDALIEHAANQRKLAYCPYSGYRVGAALLDGSGRTFSGCNVENVSYSACICAERVAIAKMVSEGGRRIQAIVVKTADGGYPCGVCLQSLLEFRNLEAQTLILVSSDKGDLQFALKELLPHGFDKFLPSNI